MKRARMLFPLAMVLAGCSSGSGHSSLASAGTTGTSEDRDAGGSSVVGGTTGVVTSSGGTRGSLGGQGGGGATNSSAAVSSAGSVAGSTEPASSTVGGGLGTGGATGSSSGGGSGGSRDAGLPDGRPDGPRDVTSDLPRPDSAESRGDTPNRDGSSCPYAGHVSYTLSRNSNPTSAETQAYGLITTAMDKAVSYYNCYTDITKALKVSYNSSVPTADGNINGSIRFGGTAYMEYITAMHEIGHTVGVGTASNWQSFVAFSSGENSGPWKGANANAELRAITGKSTDTLTADTQHFWPYGLNYTSEVKSEADVINHCRIVVALRKDMGL